jgi:gluconate 2-dehydrogenase alpha chain
MATKLKEVDVVIVGLGWTGGILGKELAAAGLKVVALERGAMRTTSDDYSLPNIRDELRYVVRQDLMMNTARDTLTVRNEPSQEALPMRRLGSFLPGEGVGGSGVHWSGHTWRWTDMEFKVRSMYEERYGKSFIPADMTIQDWGITYDELEPYYDRFEYTAAISGKAGNLRGEIQPGGNPFEAPRAREYPLPPLTGILASEMFSQAARNHGYHPFPRPSANASRAYTNPDGAKFGACQYCGYCQRFGCEANAKGSPACGGDPDRDAQSQLRIVHPCLGHEGEQGFRRQARHRRDLHQRAQRRGIRAAGRHGAAVRLCHQQRAPDAAVGHRRAL